MHLNFKILGNSAWKKRYCFFFPGIIFLHRQKFISNKGFEVKVWEAKISKSEESGRNQPYISWNIIRQSSYRFTPNRESLNLVSLSPQFVKNGHSLFFYIRVSIIPSCELTQNWFKCGYLEPISCYDQTLSIPLYPLFFSSMTVVVSISSKNFPRESYPLNLSKRFITIMQIKEWTYKDRKQFVDFQ